MTENKRFTFDNESLLKDNEFWLDGRVATICNAEEIVELLNELDNENKELEEENQKLLSLIQKGVDSWSGEKKDEHLAWKRVDVE